MKLNVKALRLRMLEAAKAVAEARWPVLETYAQMQFAKLSLALAEIQRMQAAGDIDQQRARALAVAEQNGVRSILAAVQGLGTLTAEKAMHAATRAIAAEVNNTVGFKLL